MVSERRQGGGRGLIYSSIQRQSGTVLSLLIYHFCAPCSRYDADATFFALILKPSRPDRYKVHVLPPFLPSFPPSVVMHLYSEASPFASPRPERRFEERTKTCFCTWNTIIHLKACEGQKRDSFCTEIHCSSMWGLDERILRTARPSTMKLSGLFDLYFTSCFVFVYIILFY